MSTKALEDLHTAMLDTREGYKVAARDADTDQLKSLFGEMITLRDRDHAAIHGALERAGVTPDDSGSFQGTVHKVVTSARAAITGLDEDALSPFISGEEKIVEKYDSAIVEAASEGKTRDMLEQQKVELVNKIDAMKAMKRSR